MKRARIAVIHPHLREGGGSEAVALHAVDALARDYDVSLLTMGRPDLEKLNSYYGTQIRPGSITVRTFEIPRLAKSHFLAFKIYPLERFCRRHASDFEVMLSTYNVMDFGRRGIQLIADFSFDDGLRERVSSERPQILDLLRNNPWTHRIYLGAVRAMAGTKREGWKRNLTIANSHWSARRLMERFGLESEVLYPPVSDRLPCPPWEGREDGFIYLGRISPEKRIEEIIHILRAVRELGHDIHLHIVGDTDDADYKAKIARLCAETRGWAVMEGSLGGDRKGEFIGRHRYGISARDREPFGISVAELVKAGCLVWVPDDGGQVEIVDHPELSFRAGDEAVAKIDAVLKSEARSLALRLHLAAQGRRFTAERFRTGVRTTVASFLASDPSARGSGPLDSPPGTP